MERGKGGGEWRERAIEVCAVCVILQARLCMLISSRPAKAKTRHGAVTCFSEKGPDSEGGGGEKGPNPASGSGADAASIGGTQSPLPKSHSSA